MNRKLAVFDLDGTLFKRSASFAFGVWLYKNKRLSLSQASGFTKDLALHLFCGLSLKKLHQRSFARFKTCFNVRDLPALAEQFLDDSWHELVYSPAFKRLVEAQQARDLTMIFSSSPDFLVAPIAKRFGVDRWKASFYSFNTTKGLRVLDGERKKRLLLACMRLFKIPKDFTKAYSDSDLDLPLLLEAGEAVGVNPNKRLKEVCTDKQWEII